MKRVVRSFYCRDCGETDPSKFLNYNPRVCRKCLSKRFAQSTREVEKRNRAIIREVMGTKCVSCGFDKYYGCLELHHRDPSTKRLKFCGSHYIWPENVLRDELYKCELLCRNCHNAYHAGVLKESDFEYTVEPRREKQVVISFHRPNPYPNTESVTNGWGRDPLYNNMIGKTVK